MSVLRNRSSPFGSRIEQVAEARPDLGVERRRRRGRPSTSSAGSKLVAQHRGVAQDRPVGRRELVDLAGDRATRSSPGATSIDPVVADRLEQLEQEQRVAARPSRDLLDLVGRQRLVLGGGLDDLDASPRSRAARASTATGATVGVVAGEVEPSVPGWVTMSTWRRSAPACDRRSSRSCARLVQELGVLDDEHRRRARRGSPRGTAWSTSARRSRRNRSSRAAVSGVCGQVEPEQDARAAGSTGPAPDRRRSTDVAQAARRPRSVSAVRRRARGRRA